MAEQVIIFGSFSEDEVLTQQRSFLREPGRVPEGQVGRPACSNQRPAEKAKLQPSGTTVEQETVTATPAVAVGSRVPGGQERDVGQILEKLESVAVSKSGGSSQGVTSVRKEARFDAAALLQGLREGYVTRMGLQARGLLNTGNSCFLNSVLQALLSCPPFVSILQRLREHQPPQRELPTLWAFSEFANQFKIKPLDGRNVASGGGDAAGCGVAVDLGPPLAPAMFDVVLQNFRRDNSGFWSRQEDAQEFLSFVLNQLHEELLQLEGKDVMSQQSPSSTSANDDESWETVGRKNRSAIVRTHSSEESSISAVFGGKLRSVVKTTGKKPSATVQPFLLLHLDVLPISVNSVDDALKAYVAPVPIEGYKSKSGDSQAVSASKAVQIQALPKVLVLHLTRFTYGPSGAWKVHKPVRFSLNLVVGLDLLSTARPGLEGREYELVATISHHGRDLSGGHYTTDSKQPDGRWLRFDDKTVSLVKVNTVLHDLAYLLFYKQISKS